MERYLHLNTAPKPWIRECQARWEQRIRRAHDLQSEHPAAQQILRFYEAILKFQGEVARSSESELRSGTPLRQQIELSSLLTAMPALLAVSIRTGTQTLQSSARELQAEGERRWRTLFENAVSGNQAEIEAPEGFFVQACLQPAAETLQLQSPAVPNYIKSICPICDGLAQLSVLRPEGEGASRSLICSFCLREWAFRRLACPWCGEENKESLPRYSAEECNHVYVDACDTCRRYVKAVDMSKNGLAVPLVDEAAFAVLDVWAANHGYKKLSRNLIGF
jgi:formate dehydrogenase maturation protein FdhE